MIIRVINPFALLVPRKAETSRAIEKRILSAEERIKGDRIVTLMFIVLAFVVMLSVYFLVDVQ